MNDAKDFDDKVIDIKKTPLWLKIGAGILIGLIVFVITYAMMYIMLP